MKAQNSIVTKNNSDDNKPFSAIIASDKSQELIRASLRDDGSVQRFTGTLISVVKASEQLSKCDAGSVIAAALRGEGMGLSYGHGYYVVPYGKKATYILSYKGYIQLALATGQYADIDCIDVREGERKGRDKRTGKPVVDMSVYDDDEERSKHKIIGYKAYFELKDGYYREEYWTVDELLLHADRYSKAFSRDLYLKWKSGKQLTKAEQETVENGSPWYTSTDRMMKKTVLRSLLNSGFAPLSNTLKVALRNEATSGEGDSGDLSDALGGDVIDGEYKVVDESTGEVVSETPEKPAEAPQSAPDEGKPAARQTGEKRTRARKARIAELEMDDPDAEDAESLFFGGADA